MLKKVLLPLLGLAVAGGLSAFVWALTNNKIVVGYNQGYMPDQPIPFSHKQHAGDLKIDCKYCHTSVEVSRHASVPSLNVCMNCHLVVKTDSPWIQKITEAYNSGKSVAWEKVHLLPDHVKFNHAPHIKKGVACTTCHGNVHEMEKVYQHSSLSMGFCVNCHREADPPAPLNCTTCHY
jgi:Cytochrome c7 and related cytochrome c